MAPGFARGHESRRKYFRSALRCGVGTSRRLSHTWVWRTGPIPALAQPSCTWSAQMTANKNAVMPDASLTDAPTQIHPNRRFARSLAIITVVGLAWRILFIQFESPVHFLTDEFWFVTQARRLFSSVAFTNPYDGYPSALHAPLGAIVVAPLAWIWPHGDDHLRLFSALIGAATVVVFGFVGRKFGGDRVGLLAAVVAVVTPDLWMASGLVSDDAFDGVAHRERARRRLRRTQTVDVAQRSRFRGADWTIGPGQQRVSGLRGPALGRPYGAPRAPPTAQGVAENRQSELARRGRLCRSLGPVARLQRFALSTGGWSSQRTSGKL